MLTTSRLQDALRSDDIAIQLGEYRLWVRAAGRIEHTWNLGVDQLAQIIFQFDVCPKAEDSTHAFDNVLLSQIDTLAAFGIEEEKTRQMSRQESVPEFVD